jgi:hypothetical protein
MLSKFGEIIKKLISVFGEKPGRGLPKPTPTPPRPYSAAFTRGENAISGRRRGIHPLNWDAEKKEGGGENNAILNNIITKQYFNAISSQEDVHSLSSPYCVDKLCSSPFCVAGK